MNNTSQNINMQGEAVYGAAMQGGEMYAPEQERAGGIALSRGAIALVISIVSTLLLIVTDFLLPATDSTLVIVGVLGFVGAIVSYCIVGFGDCLPVFPAG